METLLAGLPEILRAGIAAAAILAVAFIVGRRMERPIRLPDPPTAETVSMEDSAIKQFAVAMLEPYRAAAWQAVISNYPDTPEADLATLRLGVALMSGVVPNFDQAYEVFSAVRNKGELAKDKEHLKLLGMIGQAYVLKDRDRSNELDKLVTEINENVPDDEGKLTMYLDRAPARLRQFFNRIQFTNGDRTLPLFPQ